MRTAPFLQLTAPHSSNSGRRYSALQSQPHALNSVREKGQNSGETVIIMKRYFLFGFCPFRVATRPSLRTPFQQSCRHLTSDSDAKSIKRCSHCRSCRNRTRCPASMPIHCSFFFCSTPANVTLKVTPAKRVTAYFVFRRVFLSPWWG